MNEFTRFALLVEARAGLMIVKDFSEKLARVEKVTQANSDASLNMPMACSEEPAPLSSM
ncbi:hypothetical protein Cflav_PD5908 [Pedosphaera parvula Ellin514]|uniref:Uncharacterized protein n=1 Tax=Pedosphaera parvula (strain Ellin514) TaxID=320771 RepID=B9X9M9_PEDPL|nr:hypothetical protein Cflav_PD5908 [Pedosphaera parvula Ellin514]